MGRLEEIEARLDAVNEEIDGKTLWKIIKEDEELKRNAPSDLRYLLDFAKAAVELINDIAPDLNAAGMVKAAKALALLEGGSK